MKSLKKIASVLFVSLIVTGLASCKKDEDTPVVVKPDLTVNTVTNLDGVATNPVFFSLATNKKVAETEAWDLKFSTTTITINGNAQIVDGLLSAVVTAPTTGYTLTSIAGSGTWYTYDSTTHIITAVPGKVIVVKTASGKYAKIEMVSYYLDKDNTKASRYYTFKFAYQADGTTNLK